MNITEYINFLSDIRKEHGDLKVVQGDHSATLGSISEATIPSVKEEARLFSREHNRRYVLSCHPPERRTGKKVVYVGK